MGQGECLEYLEEKGGWVKTRDIAEALGQRRCNVNVPLTALFTQDEIERRRFAHKEGFEWKVK